jgi:hypothetical protein
MLPLLDIHFHACEKDAKSIAQDAQTIQFKDALIEHLNKVLDKIYDIREEGMKERGQKGKPMSRTAFTGEFHPLDKHWYIFSSGGRYEIQYNAALSPDSFRCGLGIHPGSRGGDRDKEKVRDHLDTFLEAIKENQDKFVEAATNHKLVLEWVKGTKSGIIEHRNPMRLNDVILNLDTKGLDWIFIGRTWQKSDPKDMKQLSDSKEFADKIEALCKDLWPFYEDTVLFSDIGFMPSRSRKLSPIT